MKKVDNKKVFEAEIDGKTLKLAVLRPTHKTQQAANLAYNRAFRVAVKPPDGGPGAIVRAALEDVLREQKLWDDARQSRFEELNRKLAQAEKTLARGGIRLSQAREIAVQMRRDRFDLRRLLTDRNSLDLCTAESQAENARFNHLVAACTVHADTGKPYWKSDEDYLADQSEAATKAARLMGVMVYDLDEDYEKKLPENAWLLRYNQCDSALHLIDKEGRRVDGEGRLVDGEGRFINDQGEHVDVDGNVVGEDGAPKVEFSPFLSDDDQPIAEPVAAPEPATQSV